MLLNKKQTQMTKGLVILCMVILHLFCRNGENVFGQPLLWLNSETPAVYILGFLAEICVPLYSMCSGYAHYIIGEKDGLTFKKNIIRIFKFLLNYWIVVILFSILGLIFHVPGIPGSWTEFFKVIFLIDNYGNGAWWYILVYLILCVTSKYIYFFVKKHNGIIILIVMSIIYAIVYLFSGSVINMVPNDSMLKFIAQEIQGLLQFALLAYLVGMMLVKYDIFTKVKSVKLSSMMRTIIFILISAVVFFLEKGIIMPYYAVIVFVWFNSLDLKNFSEKVFMFLGHHSTNIWLVHMFFYLCMFPGLVISAKYPVFIFLYMMCLCLISSFVINFFYNKVKKLFGW